MISEFLDDLIQNRTELAQTVDSKNESQIWPGTILKFMLEERVDRNTAEMWLISVLRSYDQ